MFVNNQEKLCLWRAELEDRNQYHRPELENQVVNQAGDETVEEA